MRTISIRRRLGSDINFLGDSSIVVVAAAEARCRRRRRRLQPPQPDPYRARPIQLCNEAGRLASDAKPPGFDHCATAASCGFRIIDPVHSEPVTGGLDSTAGRLPAAADDDDGR